MSDSNDPNDEYTLDDEFEYAGWRIGRPTRTTEVDAPDGSHTIEEGMLTCELVTEDELREAKRDAGWTAHYVAPDGGIGFGLDEGNSGGVAVPYTLEATITFPTPMTQKEADEWLPDEWFHEYPDTDVPGLERFDGSDDDIDSDTENDTGAVVEDSEGGAVIESDTTADDLLEDLL